MLERTAVVSWMMLSNNSGYSIAGYPDICTTHSFGALTIIFGVFSKNMKCMIEQKIKGYVLEILVLKNERFNDELLEQVRKENPLPGK